MRKRPRDREKNSLLCVPCILDAARRLLGCGLPDGLHGGCRRARRDEVLSETLARRGLTPGKRVIVYDTGGKDAPLDEHGARGVEFVLVGRDRPCGDPAAGLQGGAFVPREEPGTGSRIRSARCGAHVHTVQRMRNASCEYGHGSSSFRLDFHLGLTAIVHQGRNFGFTRHTAPGRGFSRSRKQAGL